MVAKSASCLLEKMSWTLSETQKNSPEVQVDDTQVPESLKNAGFGCLFSDSIGGFLQISEFSFWRPRLDHDLHFEPCPEQHRCQSRIVSTSSSILNTSLLRHSGSSVLVVILSWHI